MFERLFGCVLSLAAPIVMFFTSFLAIPDLWRYRRMQKM
jgi:hypothetical protein